MGHRMEGKWCGPSHQTIQILSSCFKQFYFPYESELGICGIVSPCEHLSVVTVVPWAGAEECSTIQGDTAWKMWLGARGGGCV